MCFALPYSICSNPICYALLQLCLLACSLTLSLAFYMHSVVNRTQVATLRSTRLNLASLLYSDGCCLLASQPAHKSAASVNVLERTGNNGAQPAIKMAKSRSSQVRRGQSASPELPRNPNCELVLEDNLIRETEACFHRRPTVPALLSAAAFRIRAWRAPC